MNNMFGAKMGQIFISINERNKSAIGRLKEMEEMARPVAKPILPAPPRQFFDTRTIKRTLTMEQSKRATMEARLKDYLKYQPKKYNQEDLLQGLMVKELLNKQLERNKKLREQVKRGLITVKDYNEQRVNDNVLISQVNTIMPLIEEPLMGMGINTEQMRNFLENPTSEETTGLNPSTAEIIADDVRDTIAEVIDGQERRAVELAPIVPTNPTRTGQSVATRTKLSLKDYRDPVIVPRLSRQELEGLSVEKLEEIASLKPIGKPTNTLKQAREILSERQSQGLRLLQSQVRSGEIERVPGPSREEEERVLRTGQAREALRSELTTSRRRRRR